MRPFGSISNRISAGLLGTALLFCDSYSAQAQISQSTAISDALRSSLARTVETYSALISRREIYEVLDFLPPRLVRAAAPTKSPTERQMIIGMMFESTFGSFAVLPDMRLTRFQMDATGIDIHTLPDGTSFAYIPTTAELQSRSTTEKLRLRYETLGITESGKWYFIQVNDNANQPLKVGYPSLPTIPVRSATVERISP